MPQRRQRRSAAGGVPIPDEWLNDGGTLVCGNIAGVMLKPHLPQKREFWGSDEEHRGHGYVAGAASPALTSMNVPPPQRPQNLTPSANREPQFEHATMPGIRLDTGELPALLPCDGEGWLEGLCGFLSCA